jgi:SulP family sulfate permease
MCSAVNAIDASALESVEAINHRMADAGVRMHLSEVKGPVMDALERSHLLHDLTGRVWLSQNEAFDAVIAIADREQEAQHPPDLWMARGLI